MNETSYDQENNHPVVRTRIAPSPTGDWHLGTARTALFTYLFAHHNSGPFYLRVEDTDRNRLAEGAEDRIHETMSWLGIEPDPYPDGNPFHRQSDNLARYQEVAQDLVRSGHAYYCFATPEELEAMRHEQEAKHLPPHYDNRWGYRDLSYEEAQKRADSGEKYVIRQKMPQSGEIRFQDVIRGEVVFQAKLLDDHVLLKSDGYPTYHLAHVVDDHDTDITHVIRGEEWLPSAPRHVVLHQLLGWNVPIYAHLPIILGPDKGKLSKRHGAKPVLDYREAGYLPEAVVNFLALLGWSSGTEEEVFSKEELINKFSLERVQASPAVFDATRLDWFNGLYIRQLVNNSGRQINYESTYNFNQDITPLKKKILSYYEERDMQWIKRAEENSQKFNNVIAAVYERMVTLKDFEQLANIFYERPKNYSPEIIPAKGQTLDEAQDVLILARERLEKFNENYSNRYEGLKKYLDDILFERKIKLGQFFLPLRSALTGVTASPGAIECLVILGKDESLARIDYAISLLSE